LTVEKEDPREWKIEHGNANSDHYSVRMNEKHEIKM